MDGESEPNHVMAEEAGEGEEPTNATPSPQQQTTTPAEESGEAVSMETEDEATKEHGVEDDDDVVLVEEEAPQPSTATSSQDTPSTECLEQADTDAGAVATVDTAVIPNSPLSSIASVVEAPHMPATIGPEPIVIDDEEDSEQKETSFSPVHPGGPSAPHSPSALSSTVADSEIRIASVTTLGSSSQKNLSLSASNSPPHSVDEQGDMNLMITSVTSLQGGAAAVISVTLASKLAASVIFSHTG